MENCEAMTSSPHSFAYSYRLVKKCFVKICETSKFHNFLVFQPIFIRFSLLCLKVFTLSSEIKLNLLWSSSLSIVMLYNKTTVLLQSHMTSVMTEFHSKLSSYKLLLLVLSMIMCISWCGSLTFEHNCISKVL